MTVVRALSLHHLTMLDATAAELVATAIAGGFDFAGIRIISPDTGLEFGDLISSAAARREVSERAADLPGGIWDVEALWLRPDTDVGALEPALATARELGARYVLTVGHDPEHGRLADRLAALAGLAAANGVALALEPITYCAVSSVQDARVLVDELARDDVSILVDALQFFRSGAALSDIADAPARLFPYAQIADGPASAPIGVDALRHEARRDRHVPGSGEFDLTGWVTALPPAIPLALEVPSAAVRALPRAEAATMLRTAVLKLLELAGARSA